MTHVHRPRLKKDWRAILRHAWSVRLMAVAGITSGLEAALPFLHEAGWLDWLPGGVFALVVFVVSFGAIIARIIVQETLDAC